MKMKLQLEKDECTIEINGKEYHGELQATVEVNYTAGTSGSMRSGSSSWDDLLEAPSPANIEVEWAECFMFLYKADGNEIEMTLKLNGVDWLQELFGEIEEEHLDADGIL
jgi:hypothetical protein